jgi:hypothetical protein
MLSGPIKDLAPKALLALLALSLCFGLSCGKRGTPQPPRERVVQRAEIGGFQRGSEVILSWQMPARNAPEGSVLNIDHIDVYRLAEPLDAPQTLSEEEFANRAVVIATMPVTDDDFGLKRLQYRDALRFAGQPIRLRYAIRYVNSSGQRAAFSNFFLVEPAARVAESPAALAAEPSQSAVVLRWQEPVQNVDGSTPVNIIGYNVYRSPGKAVTATLLNPQPVTGSEYSDRTFEFDKEFFYFVRTVSLGTGGEPVESAESNIVAIRPVDTFPPGPPSSITIAASPTTVSLFFPANPEPDVVSYRIYRSTDPDTPLPDWELMTPDGIDRTTFQDSRVEAGRTYYYYVTATDKFGNTSPPSQVVSDTVP